jgi:hypothetical protein
MFRPCTEWENPVWGYLLINYAEYALQIFLPDGQFYREVRLGGPTGTTETPLWKPFEAPEKREWAAVHKQLDKLVTQLRDDGYLRSFIRMINKSLASVPHTPNQYADSLNAVIGRPLALANIGISLELASPPLQNQSTTSKTVEPKPVTKYDFPIKIGDKDRVYDGLVGYFKASDSQVLGSELELGTIFSYYPTGEVPTTEIVPANYPLVRPYHFSSAGGGFDATPTAVDKITMQHQAKMNENLLGVIIDPFSKIHIYSGILPIASLQLPAWTLQNAMQKMTAFFHVGPILITTPDLQTRYDESKKLTADYNLVAMMEQEAVVDPAVKVDPNAPPKFTGVPIPVGGSKDWNWLQPYAIVPKPVTTDSGAVTNTGTAVTTTTQKGTKEQHWNPFVVAHLDNSPKFERGPYTAIEGYLQLRKPITGKDVL